VSLSPTIVLVTDELQRAGAELGLDAAVVRTLVERVARVEPQQGDMVRRRNAALVEAARLLHEGDMAATSSAKLLEAAVRRFECRVWPRVRDQAAPDLPPLDAALHRAFMSGARPLRSWRRILDLLK
jgi:hypothetical protein